MNTLHKRHPDPHISRHTEITAHYEACRRCGWVCQEPWSAYDYVCPQCSCHRYMPALERLAHIFDDGVWDTLGEEVVARDPLQFVDRIPYTERLAKAQHVTELSEALIVALGRCDGYKVCVAVFAFEFIGGSMGEVVGERFVRAVEYCIEHRMPLMVYVASGGARMQEGPWSLVQMARVAAAVDQLRVEGILYMTCLCHPTTGGVAASLAMIADWVIAEPDAYIAFTGSRVLGVASEDQLADPLALYAHGQIDAIVERSAQKKYFSARLALLS